MRTLVAFHAHPDDEAVLTAGTMARAVADGHRVVLVLATDGGLGGNDESHHDEDAEKRLGAVRLNEARRSADIMGVHQMRYLGYADSGPEPEAPPDPVGRVRFVRAPIGEAARALAAILVEENADVLLTYDRNGGYGHPDHLRVHQIGAAAARLADTPRVLEATAPRDLLCRAVALPSRLGWLPVGFDRASCQRLFSAKEEITHRIRLGRFVALKRKCLRAHTSQTDAKTGADRMLAAVLRLPMPIYRLVFAREWFVDSQHRGPVVGDVFAGL